MNTITKNANFTDTVPKFTKYFKIIINKLLNRNQTHSKEFHSSDLLNTTKELNEFDMEFSKVIVNPPPPMLIVNAENLILRTRH